MTLLKAGTITGNNRATATAYTTTDVTEAHGSASDLWGTTWTVADINNANFGVVYSASYVKTSSWTRTISVDHMPITVNFTVPAAALTPAAFNAYDIGTTPSTAITGYITTKIAGQAFALDLAALNSAKTALLTTFTSTVKVELLDASGGGTLDANNCNASWPVIQALPNQTFVAGDAGRHRVASVTESNAWREVSVRVTYPATGTPTTIGCSTDHFAIRPDRFINVVAKDADWATAGTTRSLTNTGVTGGVTHKAGQLFTLQATAVNTGGSTTTNYAGTVTAVLSACAGTACTAAFGNLVIGATAASGLLNSNAATYDEVGSFSLELQDQSFAVVDAADGSAASCSGRWICSTTLADVGRFVPDHFTVTIGEVINRADVAAVGTTTTADAVIGDTTLSVASATGFPVGTAVRIPYGAASADTLYATVTAQAAGSLTLDTALAADLPAGSPVNVEPGFTYFGEEMDAQLTLVAHAADGSVANNYDGVLAKLNPMAAGNPLGVGIADNAASRTFFAICGGTPAHPCFTPATATVGAFVNGTAADITVPITLYRGATAVGPFNALDVGVAPVDADGVTAQFNVDLDATAGSDHALVARTVARYGRMRLGSAYGSELLPLPVSAIIQFWNGSAWVTSTGDYQSTFAAASVVFSNYRLNLTVANVVTPPASVVFTKGVGIFKLAAPGMGKNGSVDLMTIAPAYLPSNTARAAFGLYKSPLIFRRESF